RLQSSWSAAADAYREVLEQVGDTRRRPMVNGGASRPRPGVNVLADLRASTGIAEAARRHSLALLDAGASMTYTEFNSRAPYRTAPVPARIAALRGGKDHPVDLWMLNLNEFELVPEESLDRYGIALWAWEMPVVFDETLVQLKRLNELWVVSSFVADAFRTVTDIPITVVPNVVPRIRARADRTRLGLPDDALIVLFSFSAASSDARKNPWGAIEAFRRAFPAAERGRSAHLVIKAVDLADHPEMSQHLAEKVAAVDGLLISQDLAREDMDRLLASCDIYLSLHRSEGFGFGIAEAMSLGKPVIATGHGGNLDFMPPGAGATVGYTIREITDADHRFGPQFAQWYRPGQLWAEPDVNQAARWLRRMADDAGLRRTMGSRGAAAVRRLCSAEAVGATMLRRLAKIDPTHT
ncbi:MAG: glycosyltransferase family 4 protein, partial [Thermocrispum sp.]